MNIYKINFNAPYFWSGDDKEEKKARSVAHFESSLASCGLRSFDPHCVVVTDQQLGKVLSLFELGNATDFYCISSITQLLEVSNTEFPELEYLFNQIELNTRRAVDTVALFNNLTQSPISGNHLMEVNQTMLCEDFCTDALQNYLAEGWRILAVCPQEARRPDYILGKHVSSPDTRAMRG